MKKIFTFMILLVLIIPFSVYGLVRQSQYKYVTDEANIMSDDLVNYIYIYSKFLKEKMDINYYVVSVNNVEEYDLESYSEYVFNNFNVGSRGLLIFISKEDRKIRVDIGYELDDVLSTEILNNYIDIYIMPYLKNGNWEDGIKNGYSAYYKEICDYYNVDSSELVVEDARYMTSNYKSYIILAIIFINSFISYVFTSFFMRLYRGNDNYKGKIKDFILFIICLLINIILFYLAFILMPISLVIVLVFEFLAIKTNYDKNYNFKKINKKIIKKNKKVIKHKRHKGSK